MKFTSLLLSLGLVLSASACVEKSRDLTRTEREQLERFVSESPTTPDHAVSIDFEGKVELVGYDLSSETWAPGSEMTLTWHWKVNRALEDGWRLFTHVSDGRTPTRVNEDGAGLVRDLYQPGRWKAGEYIRDQQVITLPADWNAATAVVYVGLWNGPHRLRVSEGPSDGDNRGRAATVRVGGEAAAAEAPQQPDVPTLVATRAGLDNVAINIDGNLDEPSWQRAASTRAFVNTMSGSAADFSVTAKTLFDDDNFYVGFIVADDFLKSAFTQQDDHLWEGDAVEIMVDPDGDGRNYFELQVSPRNVSFDTRYDSRRQPQPIGHADWNSGLRSAVSVRGTIDDDDEDEGYTVEIAIPWTAFAHGTPPASPPSAGDQWRVNFFVMDSRAEGQRAAGWSPPRVGDFHVPERFGIVRFGAAAAPTGPAAGTPMVELPAALRNRVRGELQPGRQGLGIPTEREQYDETHPQEGEVAPTPMAPAPSMAPSMAP